jgi:cell division protease FtsH
MSSTAKTLVFWLVIVLSAFLLWQVIRARPDQHIREISYSEFLSSVEASRVATVTISGNEIMGRLRDGGSFRVTVPSSQESLLQMLHQKDVEIWIRNVPNAASPTWLLNVAPLILLAALWFFMVRQLRPSGGRAQANPGRSDLGR